MPGCRCLTPPFSAGDYDSSGVGIDLTDSRHGEVEVQRCRHCGSIWLRYYREDPGFSRSGRWYRGLISAEAAAAVAPETAAELLRSLPWRFEGGSYFESRGRRTSAPLRLEFL